MSRSKCLLVAGPLALAALAMLLAGCSDSNDDPGESPNRVTMAASDPLEACVDIDGTLEDTDGDGSKDDPVFFSVSQQITFDSRVRGSVASEWEDVILEEVEFSYDLRGGVSPPKRSSGISVTIPAGGTASTGITTVDAKDIIAGYFDGVREGTINVKFRGHDVSGEPIRVSGRIPLVTANACEGL